MFFLEMVGDAVLEYIIIRQIYDDSRHFTAQELLDIASHLLNNTILAVIAVRNSFHKYLRYNSPKERYFANKYATDQRKNKYKTPKGVRVRLTIQIFDSIEFCI